MSQATPIQRLASILLDRPVEDWIEARRRESEPPRAWRLIARDLYEATDGEIDVTAETLRLWSREAAA